MTRIRLLFALTALSLGGCDDFGNEPTASVTVTAAANRVDLALGDTAHIAITVRNDGDQVVEVTDPHCNDSFFITDGDGVAWNPAEQIYCTLELRAPIRLAPSQSRTFASFTTGRVVRQGSLDGPVMLSPGTYRIRPVVHVWSGDDGAVVVSANPIMVTFR